jgi:hydroxymethylpyrimidine pyrophosphatase-like HAD family hydrolase
LDAGLLALKDQYSRQGIDFEFGPVTARPPVRVASENLPTPDWCITYNGGYIHRGAPGHYEGSHYVVNPPLPAWVQANDATGFNAGQAGHVLQDLLADQRFQNLRLRTIGQVVGNPAADACPYVYSPCIEESSVQLSPQEAQDENHNQVPDVFDANTFHPPTQVAQLVDELRQRLAARHVPCAVSPVYPAEGRPLVMFDVTTPMADKGDAVEYLRKLCSLPADHLIVAGNGGNDISMMRAPDGTDDGRRAIVVGGEADLYKAAAGLEHLYAAPADMDCSLGVLEGFRHHLEALALQLSDRR